MSVYVISPFSLVEIQALPPTPPTFFQLPSDLLLVAFYLLYFLFCHTELLLYMQLYMHLLFYGFLILVILERTSPLLGFLLALSWFPF